jgi:DNA-3-methyladenine glycosylase II
MSELAIAHLSNVDATLRGVITAVGQYTFKVDPDCAPFQTLAQAIAHQQLNGTAARTILTRFVNTCGNGAFPTPEAVLATPQATLRAAGFSFAKIASLRDLAAKTIAGTVPDHPTLDTLGDEEIITRLTQVRGIGRWTVEMMLIFRLGRPDILPVDDFGVRNGFRLAYGLREMPAPMALAAFGERWGPYRSTAAWYLWRAVELARSGTLPIPLERVRLPRLRRKRRARRTDRGTSAATRARRTDHGTSAATRARRTDRGTSAATRARRTARGTTAVARPTRTASKRPVKSPSATRARAKSQARPRRKSQPATRLRKARSKRARR